MCMYQYVCMYTCVCIHDRCKAVKEVVSYPRSEVRPSGGSEKENWLYQVTVGVALVEHS